VNADRALTQNVKASLPQLIQFMARKVTPEDPRPGLGLSYSEIVGALYAMSEGHGTHAPFTTETERLNAQLAGAKSSRELVERPESPEDRQLVILNRDQDQAAPLPVAKPQGPRIIPIQPPSDKKKG
jgi:hypothetical protein